MIRVTHELRNKPMEKVLTTELRRLPMHCPGRHYKQHWHCLHFASRFCGFARPFLLRDPSAGSGIPQPTASAYETKLSNEKCGLKQTKREMKRSHFLECFVWPKRKCETLFSFLRNLPLALPGRRHTCATFDNKNELTELPDIIF